MEPLLNLGPLLADAREKHQQAMANLADEVT